MTKPPRPSPSSHLDPAEREVDAMLLPPMRQRLHDLFLYLTIFQGAYSIAIVTSAGDAWWARLALNLTRLAVLALCVRLLRGEGSRRHTLTVAAVGLSTQFIVGTIAAVLRNDVTPAALIQVAINCVTAGLIPWGFGPQLVLALSTGASLSLASLVVRANGGTWLVFDSAATVFTTIAFTTWVALFLERSRRTLETRLAEARRADEELSLLRADLERRVTERTAELEMANRELEGFSYTVSHDLRSPLRTISGFSEMVLEESGPRLDEAARGHLSKIRAACGRMDELIDDMLLLARVGRTPLRYETVDVANMALSIAAQLAGEQPERNVKCVVGEIPPVPADHALLRIALDNLLRNAWKFTGGRESARVTVSGEWRDGRVLIRVEDNGAGFDPRFRHKLFLPFERLHEHERFPGTGVGLATVARIAHRHGGEVKADGGVDCGATFTIALPAVRPA